MPEGNVAVAFACVIGAGACTSLGAALAFCINLENKRFLAVSLALSCGVMFYVSMVEIFVKSLNAFSSEYCPERVLGDACPHGYGATTGFFFLGLAITAGLNMLVSNLEYLCGKCGLTCFRPSETDATKSGQVEPPASEFLSPENCHSAGAQASTDKEVLQPEAQPLPPGWEVRLMRGSMKPFFYHTKSKKFMWSFPGLSGDADCVCSTSHTDSFDVEMSVECPKLILEVCKDKPVLGEHKQDEHKQQDSIQDSILEVQAVEVEDSRVSESASKVSESASGTGLMAHEAKDLEHQSTALLVSLKDADRESKLKSMGLLTGLAIAIHNFPEGLATFVAAMAEPSLGAALAVAIAIHNVPEGVCVAMPIYYATGSKMRAFGWATLSGMSEPLGALFGYCVLGGDVGNVAYGAMFGIVAGMMVYISLAELLPSAHRFDSNGGVIMGSMVAGMAIMAVSLMAFQL